jgi:phosphotransferase system enzyme I (PtsI)
MARLELSAISVSPGVGVARAYIVANSHVGCGLERTIGVAEVDSAIAAYEKAKRRAIQSLTHIQAATAKELGIQDAAIYGAQIAVIQDPDANHEIRTGISENLLAPESAIQALLAKFEGLFEALEGGDLKSWAADLRDPWQTVLRELDEEGREALEQSDDPVILFADELAPSLATRIPRELIAGIVCGRGGRFSHGAVVARSFGIPTITGAEKITTKAVAGETCVVHGEEGRVLLGATKKEQTDAARLAKERAQVRLAFANLAHEPGRVGEDYPIKICVNIESPRDLAMFDLDTVEGVGLFRTEFAYMERATFPSAKEQEELYVGILDSFKGKPVVFRTLDIGNDKQLRYFTMPKEQNPAMGWRGLRMSLQWKDILLVQIQALVAARKKGDARLLLPMVTNVEEVREVKKLIAQVAGSADAIPLGVMVEVPAAAMGLRDLLAEVDFISVGTNDLAQYLFAVDRDNPWVADLYQPYHPAHLRVLRFLGNTCRRANVPLSVCGEMAGQRAGALFLIGAGFDQLSMAPPFVAEMKAMLREVNIVELRDLASQATACSTNMEALQLLENAGNRAWEAALARNPGLSD